ncbi:MAG: DUF4010 domain-containing protein [Deltaproteobacteria bacterium]|jgi:uncharacterized membrane protein (DUF4010 family)|nr:DUF4010 domain-containing protein [Deltaproteobacteria bacterium]MBW2536252.1 DUF4010 domain-containing protein [Deltaproteobacteria bacterium]
MSFREIILSIVVAVAAGALIGAERQQTADDDDGQTPEALGFGGIRTFPLIALLGALGALAKPIAGLWLLGGLLLGVTAFVTVSHIYSGARKALGISSEVAALLTFALGAIAAMHDLMPHTQRYLLVGSSAAIILALLALKKPLHDFAEKVSAADIYATVKFVILALIILPVLPNQTYGPLDVLNPYKVGMMIVLVAGISFAGYVAARVVGQQRGLLVAGLLGGLVSSTAVTMTFAGRAKEQEKLAAVCTVAIVAACSTMFARVVGVIAVVERPLLMSLAPALGTMAVVGFGASAWLYRSAGKTAQQEAQEGAGETKLKNPFALKQAISFGILYGVVLFVAKAAQTYLGSGGLYASAVLAGLTDVDAITLSVAELHQGGLESSTAANAITLAAVTNTIVKTGIAISIGGKALGRKVGAIMGAALVAGGIVLVVLGMRG